MGDSYTKNFAGRADKYESLYIWSTWLFIVLGLVYTVFMDFLNERLYTKTSIIIMHFCYFLSIIILNYLKKIILKREMLQKYNTYMGVRMLELLLLMFGIVFVGLGDFGFLFFTVMLIVTSLSRGTKTGMILLAAMFALNPIFYSLDRYVFELGTYNRFHRGETAEEIIIVISYFVIYILLAGICGKIHYENLDAERQNQNLVKELGEKYDLLAIAQEEAKVQYERLKDTNSRLEETNTRLTSSIAEFYTLQQISSAISSIFDVKELLRYVNDIILGVMGVNYSTIVLYDEKRKKLKVHTTNIKDQDEIIALTDNINCNILIDTLNNAKPILENFVDCEEYTFTKGREVKSLICIPLNTKTRSFGLVLVEHKYHNAFDDNNLRLLDIIGQQVGIAMENAELYQKMQEMATIDGLTGVYNRLYFQERLKSELANAISGEYHLSLAIFDIDHFKRFNDTFGHLFGDKVLKKISEIVKGDLRNTDVLARFGGEEFIILFPHTALEEAYEKVEALRLKISKTFVKDELVTASVTVSFGISSYPSCAVSEAELLRVADDALYKAKESGRNCVKLANIL
ncbi:MAG: sensor domain-containing diguanylate cyclase [Clostridia bacterium]|nr:sensor domain-containing diguanylate cyclase [Clostridia bacterium]